MSCPDWRAVVARRDRGEAEAEAVWDEALTHASHCPRCAQRAREAEPLLVFRALAEPAQRDEDAAAAQIREMRAAVETLRRTSSARSLASGAEARGGRRRASNAGRRAATGIAASFLLALSLVLLPGSAPDRGPDPQAPVPASDASRPPSFGASAAGRSAALLDGPPRPGARIYELRQDDLAVVMIVDESLDV